MQRVLRSNDRPATSVTPPRSQTCGWRMPVYMYMHVQVLGGGISLAAAHLLLSAAAAGTACAPRQLLLWGAAAAALRPALLQAMRGPYHGEAATVCN